MKARRGPVEQVKVGNFVASIHATPSTKGGKVYSGFTGRYTLAGKVRRIWRAKIEDLRALIREELRPLATGKVNDVVLRGPERVMYERATDVAASMGMDIDRAIHELAEIRELEKQAGCRAADVFAFHRKHHSSEKQAMPVSEVVAEFLAQKAKAGNSATDQRDLHLHLGWLVQRFRGPLRDIGPDDWVAFLGDFKVNPITRRKYRGSFSRLVNWARKRGYLPPDHQGVPDDLSQVKHPPKREPLIQRLERDGIIRHTPAKHLPAVLLAAYVPIRTAELGRASFEDVNLETGQMFVYADGSKVGATRILRLAPEVLDRFRCFNGRTGPITNLKCLSRLWTRLAKKAGVQWRRNGWRKVVLSHLAALTQNLDWVAAQGGTSRQKLLNTYITQVDPREGAAWFGVPSGELSPFRSPFFPGTSASASGTPAAAPQPQDGRVVPFPGVQRVA